MSTVNPQPGSELARFTETRRRLLASQPSQPETNTPPGIAEDTPPQNRQKVGPGKFTLEQGPVEPETSTGQPEAQPYTDSPPVDTEGPIRFRTLRNVFEAANTNGNKVVSKRELNNVDRSSLNARQNRALDLLIENYDNVAGPGRITLEDIRTVASLDGRRSQISEEDLTAAPDQIRGRQLKAQARDEYGIDLVGDVDDESIIRLIRDLDQLPDDILEFYRDSGRGIELNEGDLSEYGFEHATGGLLPGFAFSDRIVISEIGLRDDSTHGSADLVLHELAHVLDDFGGDDSQLSDISTSREFLNLIERPRVRSFIEELLGVDTFHANAPQENFAELFAYFHSDDTDRSRIPRGVRNFFRNLEFVA